MKSKPGSFYFFKGKEIPDVNKWQLLRLRGKDTLSEKAKLKLEWIIFYQTIGKGKALLTAKHFGINPKTLHKWKKRFDEKNLRTLEDEFKAPKNTRKKGISKARPKARRVLEAKTR